MRIALVAAALLLAAFQNPGPAPTPAPVPRPNPSPSVSPSPSGSPTPPARPPAPDPHTIGNADHASRPPERNADNSAADTRDDQPPHPRG